MKKKMMEKKIKAQMGITDRIPASERPIVTCGTVTFADRRHPARDSRRARQVLKRDISDQMS